MASPFSIFRKNQKVMIAVLGVLAMFAFVFIPMIMQGGGGRAAADPVVVEDYKVRQSACELHTDLADQPPRVLNVLGQLKAMGDMAARRWQGGKISEETAKAIQDRYAPEAVPPEI